MELTFRTELCNLDGGKSVMVITGGSADAAKKVQNGNLEQSAIQGCVRDRAETDDAKRCIELISLGRSMTFPHLGLTGNRLHFRGSPFEPNYD